MPLAERDSNGSGRNSRASNMSAGSRSLQPKGPPSSRNNDLFSSAPGVASMLRTSTELGNLGGIAYDTSSNMPNVPRAPPRSGAASRMSTGSSHSNTSRRDSRPRSAQHQAWPSGSSGPRHSMTRYGAMPDYIADTLSPTMMNLPGSSPLIPHSSGSRDGRSRSMTHASQPIMTLNSNRSYTSLRNQDIAQRPRSPFDGYPQQFRRGGPMRPVSPAASDYTDSRPRRWPGDQPYPRQRGPPEMQMRRGQLGQMGPMGPMMVPPLRTRSPAYYANPNHHADIPPVPPIPSHHRHRAVSHTRIMHNKQARGSSSSGFTNQRADSEAPSSDEPSPPTPKDGPLMGTLVSPTGAHMLIDPANVDYYDGSEEFYEREEYPMSDPDTFHTGFGQGFKTIIEERLPVDTSAELNVVVVEKEEVDLPDPDLHGRAELPASPVARRITRDLVLQALGEPGSSTDYGASSTGVQEAKSATGSSGKGEMAEATGPAKQEIVSGVPPHLEGDADYRQSVISHAATSLMESSTVELAMRYSSPGANGMSPGSLNVTSEDGMSDLLDGYQHTEMQDDSELDVQEPPVPQTPAAKKKAVHTPKSSDAQSFKSCTDLPEHPFKDSDAKSFRTCKDVVTPDRAVSMPAARVPAPIFEKQEPKVQRAASEMPLSSPLAKSPGTRSPATIVRKKHRLPLRESSFPKVAGRIRANSKVSSRNASIVTSNSSSGDFGHQQPIVPPRESSSSQEAQHVTAVASFLIGGFRRANKFRKRSTRIEVSPPPSINEDASSVKEASVFQLTGPGPRGIFPMNDKPTLASLIGAPSKDASDLKADTPMQPTRAQAATPSRYRAFSTPSAPLPAPSSVYSPDDISSSSKGRTQSSPPDLSKSPLENQRDSQSTTHLVWPRRSMHMRSITTPERPCTINEGDDTTTDLRFSSYRQPMLMHYHQLADVKEESHEDSSLNTSASNLKNSTFRFPHGAHPGVRGSVEDSLLFRRSNSVKSIRNSVLLQTRGLPSMNFSGLDLISNMHDMFEPRTTRSFDDGDRAEVARSLARSTSDGGIHDKYKSLFGGLEGAKSPDEAQTAMDLAAIKHRYSPRDYLTDIEMVDVPSVNQLTLRLSEYFPRLGNGVLRDDRKSNGEFIVEEEEIIGHVREELQEVGVVVGVGAPAQKRSSARLRPVPGSPNMLVVDDALYEELTGREKEVAGGDTDGGSRSGGRSGVVNGSSQGKTPLAELEAPTAAKLRPRSLSLGDRPSSRQSLRRSQLSLPSTPTASTDTVPWRNEGNYPWTALPPPDISLPAPAASKGSPGPSPLRLRLSQSSETGLTSPSKPRGSRGVNQVTEVTGEARSSRLLGPSRDLKRDNNPSPPVSFDNNGFLIGPIDVRGGDQSHEAGDRYPTSSLSPPSNVNLSNITPDHPRCSDSDDDLASPRRSRKLSLLPRFTSSRTSPAVQGESTGVATSASDAHHRNEGESRHTSKRVSNHTRRNTFTNASAFPPKQVRMSRFSRNIKNKWWAFKRRCAKLFKGEPTLDDLAKEHHREQDEAPRRPPLMVDSHYVPQDVLENRALMPDYVYSGSPPPTKYRFGLYPKN